MRAVLLVPLFLALFSKPADATRQEDVAWLAEKKKEAGVVSLKSGLLYKVLKSGPPGGLTPNASSPCSCHYTGKLTDGTVFDSSVSRGQPSTFAPNGVIRGWTEALQLMKEGDTWELYIPSNLAYGDRGTGRIPAGAALIFELQLIKVMPSLGWIEYLKQNPNMLLLGFAALYFIYNNFGGGGSAHKQVPMSKASGVSGNPVVWLDVNIGGQPQGRVVLELFKSVVPKTAENFRALCTGEKVGTSGKPLTFKNCPFHRIIPGFMCQGGDFTNQDGTGGESIYGNKFADEFNNGAVFHTEPGLLSMANSGRNTNGSQFFLTTAATPWLDGKHVVFGKVKSGMDVVRAMEKQGTGGGQTMKPVVIADCGEGEHAHQE